MKRLFAFLIRQPKPVVNWRDGMKQPTPSRAVESQGVRYSSVRLHATNETPFGKWW